MSSCPPKVLEIDGWFSREKPYRDQGDSPALKTLTS